MLIGISNAIKERGRIYLEVFRELSKRYGETEAVSVMRSASHAHGTAVGEALAHLGPRDFAGMAECYAKTPDDGVTYSTATSTDRRNTGAQSFCWRFKS